MVMGKGVKEYDKLLFRDMAINTTRAEKIDVIVAIGGDGAMLDAVHNYSHLKKPFIGFNKGHVGFLMNDITPENGDELREIIENAHPLHLWFVEGEVFFDDGSREIIKGFNEISWMPDGGHALKMDIIIDGREMGDTVMGDGFIFSTPQGSTAYNRNAHGVIIKPGMEILQLTPKICEIGARRVVMNPILEDSNTEFVVNFVGWEWRPVNVFHDNLRVKRRGRKIRSIRLYKSNSSATLLFEDEFSFYDKVYQLKFHQ